MGGVTLLVGTTKGLFLISSTDRANWQVDGPHCELWPINHAIGDGGTIWAITKIKRELKI